MTPALDYSKIADLYDSFVDFAGDLPFFIDECRQVQGRVLELTSGTGRVSLPLLEKGVDLTCVDSSPEMLDHLRRKLEQRGLSARIVEQDVTRLTLSGPFELVFIPFNSFAELATVDEQLAALASVHRVLSPKGRFICTLHNPPVKLSQLGAGPTVASRGEIDGDELTVELDVEFDAATGTVAGTETVTRRDSANRLVSRRSVSIRFALIEEPSFRRKAQRTGFVVESLYGDYDRSPFDHHSSPFMIWCLRKRPAAEAPPT